MTSQVLSRSGQLVDALLAEYFDVRDGTLAIGGISATELAKRYGTPLYVYDGGVMRASYTKLCRAVSGLAEVYYSIKANPNQRIVKLFVDEGAGLEVASGEELRRAMAAGCKPSRILFAGPGKGAAELALALQFGIGEIHVESFEEIAQLGGLVAQLGAHARIAIRVNPIASARGGAMQMGGRPSPFGFDEENVEAAVAAVRKHPLLHLSGVHIFSGTQILDSDILETQWAHSIDIAAKVADLTGLPVESIDLGGGLGVPYYNGERPLDLAAVANAVPTLRAKLEAHPLLKDARVVLEPGRYLCAPAGIYLMSVRAVKSSRGTRFVVCDGGMHHHLAASGNLGQIVRRDYPIIAAQGVRQLASPCTVVGPLCTPLDTLGRNVFLPCVREGDLVAVLQSGAYGLTASPTGFLSHPTPAEVLVEQGKLTLIRTRGDNMSTGQ